MRKKVLKRIWIPAAVFLAAGILAWQLPKRIRAVFEEEKAVHINPDDIEESTLVIGTHLIYLGSLSDSLYEVASQSARESGQLEIYYKSELGEGRWYAISDAASIKAVSDEGKDVDKSKIAGLYLTHHTKPDGITYDLIADKAVSIYDIYSPYDLKGMQELSALVKQTELNGKGESIFDLEVESDTTELYDQWLKGLKDCETRMKAAGASKEQLELLGKSMGKVDALRRNEVYTRLETELQSLLDAEGGEDAAFNDAAAECITQIEDSLFMTDGNKLEDGTTTMTKVEADLIRDLIETTKPESADEGEEPVEKTPEELAQFMDKCDTLLKDMVTLYHIMNGKTVSPEAEEKFLAETLIPAAEKAYLDNPTEITQNELQYYVAEKADRADAAVSGNEELNLLYDEKEKLKEDRIAASNQGDLTEVKRIDALLESRDAQIEEKEKRISREIETVLDKKAGLETQLADAKNAGAATAELEERMAELDSQITDLAGSISVRVKDLYNELGGLKEEKLSALDQENLTEAERVETLMEEKTLMIKEKERLLSNITSSILEQKTELEQQLTEAYKEGSDTKELEQRVAGLDSQITLLNAGSVEESTTARLLKLKKEALEALEEGTDGIARLSGALEGVGALCETNPDLAGSTLEALHQKMAARKYLDDSADYDGVLKRTEELLEEHLVVLDQVMDAQSALILMDEEAGGDMNAALVGLSMFCEQAAGEGMEDLKDLLDAKVKAGAEDESAFSFPEVSAENGTACIPADVAAKYASYRYIWNDNKKRATLASRGSYYIFTAFDTTVIREKEAEEALSTPAGFQSTVYIPGDYAKQEFGCEVYKVPGTGYCILIDEGITKAAARVCDALLQKGE